MEYEYKRTGCICPIIAGLVLYGILWLILIILLGCSISSMNDLKEKSAIICIVLFIISLIHIICCCFIMCKSYSFWKCMKWYLLIYFLIHSALSIFAFSYNGYEWHKWEKNKDPSDDSAYLSKLVYVWMTIGLAVELLLFCLFTIPLFFLYKVGHKDAAEDQESYTQLMN